MKRRLAAFGQQLALQKERAATHARSNSPDARDSAKAHMAHEFIVRAGKVQPFQFTPPPVPGTLIGTWRAGEGAGGADNTGVYTFYFDNTGGVGTTPRKIVLEADFFAD
jgi:hypothetical protein